MNSLYNRDLKIAILIVVIEIIYQKLFDPLVEITFYLYILTIQFIQFHYQLLTLQNIQQNNMSFLQLCLPNDHELVS